jgi:hypothetical protein
VTIINNELSITIIDALNIFPPSIEEKILSNSKFCSDHSIATDTLISIGNSKILFSRSKLFETIREVFLTSLTLDLKDMSGTTYSISKVPDSMATISIEALDLNININIKVFWPIVSNTELRKLIFESEAKRRNISKSDYEKWQSIISSEKVSDENVSDIIADLELTPLCNEELLKSELKHQRNELRSLVPDNILYYERFVGLYDSSNNIYEYSNNELNLYLASRINADVRYLDLLLCSHLAISENIGKGIVDGAQFSILVEIALQKKDPLALIGCFEIGIKYFLDSNRLELNKIFDCMCDSEINKSLTLLSSMTMFIDGELARLKIFKDKPAFYRRLASITQASLATKAALEQGNEFTDIEQWAMEERGSWFYCQTFIDLREEPRWLPGYLNPDQLKSELFGRIYNVCKNSQESDFCSSFLQKLDSKSLLQANAFLPGPLEGNVEAVEVPDFMSEKLNCNTNDPASLEAFTILITTAQFWKIDERYVDNAVMLLENAQHQLKETNDKDSIYQTLNGLAKVAGLVRSKKLASSVMILSRIYRDYLNVNAEPANIMGIGLAASSAYQDKNEWADYIGQWFNELAYLPLESNAVSFLKHWIEQFCILEPYLYYTCGRPLEILRCLESD